MTQPSGGREPSRRDRTRPGELIGLSAVVGVVIAVIAFFSTRTLMVAVEFGGIAFIVSLVVFAMLLLAVSPKTDDRPDDDERRGH